MFRSLRVFGAMISLAAISACNDNDGNFVHITNTAVVRLVNATDVPISIVVNGVQDTLNTNILFGQQSSCLFVDLTTLPTTPALVLTNGTTHAIFPPFNPPLVIGGSFTIIAFANANGLIQFATLSNAFTPGVNNAGLRFFNGAPASGSLFMVVNGTTVTSGVPFANASDFVSVGTQTLQPVIFTNGASTVLDAGTMAFTAGTNATIVLGGPGTGVLTPIRFFTTVGC